MINMIIVVSDYFLKCTVLYEYYLNVPMLMNVIDLNELKEDIFYTQGKRDRDSEPRCSFLFLAS